jgi:hypothetical protein
VELNKLALLKSAFQSMWPAVIMGLSVYYLADKIHFLIAIPIGAVIYFALSFLSGGLNMYMAKRVILKVRP